MIPCAYRACKLVWWVYFHGMYFFFKLLNNLCLRITSWFSVVVNYVIPGCSCCLLQQIYPCLLYAYCIFVLTFEFTNCKSQLINETFTQYVLDCSSLNHNICQILKCFYLLACVTACFNCYIFLYLRERGRKGEIW